MSVWQFPGTYKPLFANKQGSNYDMEDKRYLQLGFNSFWHTLAYSVRLASDPHQRTYYTHHEIKTLDRFQVIRKLQIIQIHLSLAEQFPAPVKAR